MSKIFQGKVISNKMDKTAIVEVSRLVPHPIYKKLMAKSKKFKVDTNNQKVEVGQTVKIIETKPISAYKHFAILAAKKPVEAVAQPKITKVKKEKKA